MSSESKKRRIPWLNSVLSDQNQLKNEPEQTAVITENATEVPSLPLTQPEQSAAAGGKDIFSRDTQDKIAMDVIVSIENILKDRQLLSYKNADLEDQIQTANETINRLKHDLIKKDQLIQEKNKEIRDLENSLTSKQMSYDQLLEDYKEYQLKANMEYDMISDQLETAKSKYAKLNEDFTIAQQQSTLRIKDLEDQIRNLEIENQKYAEQYQRIADEKAKLMQTIQDFTERMSFSFSAKTTDSAQ